MVLSRRLICWVMVMGLLTAAQSAIGQASSGNDKSGNAVPVSVLEKIFFDAIRSGNVEDVLSYVSKDGVNVGPDAQRTSQEAVEQEFAGHRGLYCRLFDSSCIRASIDLANSKRTCSYRELLTHSKEVRTAASAMTRGGVRQAVLVARIKSDKCPNQSLIDFVFNLQADGWKLFSIP
jgi:hypothetical protein